MTRKRKVVKYNRVYTIRVKGQTDTTMPEDLPFGLKTIDDVLTAMVGFLDGEMKNRSVTIEVNDD